MAYANASRKNGFVPMMPAGRADAIVKARPIASPRHASTGGNASTDMAVGDAVAMDANGNIYRAGPTDVVMGVLWGFRIQAVANVMNGMGPISVEYVTGTQTAVGLVIEDAGVWFSVQSDTFAVTNIGGKFNLTDAAPDSLFRVSQQQLNVAGGAGLQFQAEDITQDTADNTYGTNARVMVRMLQTFNS